LNLKPLFSAAFVFNEYFEFLNGRLKNQADPPEK